MVHAHCPLTAALTALAAQQRGQMTTAHHTNARTEQGLLTVISVHTQQSLDQSHEYDDTMVFLLMAIAQRHAEAYPRCQCRSLGSRSSQTPQHSPDETPSEPMQPEHRVMKLGADRAGERRKTVN